MRSASSLVCDIPQECINLHVPSRTILRSPLLPQGRHKEGMDLRARISAEINRHEGMTVRSLSLKAGMSDSALHKFMTGKTKSLTVDNVEKLAKALGMTMRQLMFEGGADVEYIWDRIDARDRGRALKVLEGFVDRDAGDGAA